MPEIYVVTRGEQEPLVYGSLKSLALALMASDPAIIAAAKTLGQEIGKAVRPFAAALGEKLPTIGSFADVSLGRVYRLAVLKTDTAGETSEKKRPGRKPGKGKGQPEVEEQQAAE